MSDFDHEEHASLSSGAPGLDGVERAILEMAAAERAGVFRPTPVSQETAGLAATAPLESAFRVSERPVRRFGLSRKQAAMWLTPIAAAVVLAIGLGGYMFRLELDGIRQHRARVIAQLNAPGTAPVIGPASDCEGDFLKCCYGKSVTGLASRCAGYDRNGDGTIDLFDYQTYQIGYGKLVRNN